ncbi:putative mitochondrial carrier domain-containing protein [Neospora caninum Liverpool]|uniref:Putative mitochondrial carrier domain-containing protein n=1 Tax=Neospora caninum (strain Liverpool) TaxID=572307 RepID=F0VK13_NEOCL|nr:putative mitochondrial carrier domain-containing protein [Neospora caninum Liverpool]CBZ54058.1 putative mitochondrial carrier domain-containing protein [Neospora caninum Liverpool]|eukprot:XP_003884089.1 putative mitochondrial carrier domain-containing protein [Neospora caninum Liverpool]
MQGDSSLAQRLQELQTLARRHASESPRSVPCPPAQPSVSPQQLRLLLSRQESLRQTLAASACLPTPPLASLPPTSAARPLSQDAADEAQFLGGEATGQKNVPVGLAHAVGNDSSQHPARSVSLGSLPGGAASGGPASGGRGTVSGVGEARGNSISPSAQMLLQLFLQQQMRLKQDGDRPPCSSSDALTPGSAAPSSNTKAGPAPVSSPPTQTPVPRPSSLPLRGARHPPPSAQASGPLASLIPRSPLEGQPASGGATAVVEPDAAKQLRLLLQALHGNARGEIPAFGPRGLAPHLPSMSPSSWRGPSLGTGNDALLAQLFRSALLSAQSQGHSAVSPSTYSAPGSSGGPNPSSLAPFPPLSATPSASVPPVQSPPTAETAAVTAPVSPPPSLPPQQVATARLLLESLRGREGEPGAPGVSRVAALLQRLLREKGVAPTSLASAPFAGRPASPPPAPPAGGSAADSATQRLLASLASSLGSGLGGAASRKAGFPSSPSRSASPGPQIGPADLRHRLLSLSSSLGLAAPRQHPSGASGDSLPAPSLPSPAVASSLLGQRSGETAALFAAAFAQQARMLLERKRGREGDERSGGRKEARQERKDESSTHRKKGADKKAVASLAVGVGTGPTQRGRKDREEALDAEPDKEEGTDKASRSLSLPVRARPSRGRGRLGAEARNPSSPAGRRLEVGKSEGDKQEQAGSEAQAKRQIQGGVNAKTGRRVSPPRALPSTAGPKRKRGGRSLDPAAGQTGARRGSAVSYVERHPRTAGSCLDEEEEEDSSRAKDTSSTASASAHRRPSSPSSVGKSPASGAPADAVSPTDDATSSSSEEPEEEPEEDQETPVFREGPPMTDEELRRAAEGVQNIPALTVPALVRAAVLPVRIEGFHALEETQLLSGRKDWLRYECPLCDRQAHPPDAYWANFQHYLTCHWRRRQRLGGYVCFPCRRRHDLSLKAGSTGSVSESGSSAGAVSSSVSAPPSPSSLSQGVSKGGKLSCGPRRGRKYHFHCPLCAEVFRTFPCLQRHAFAAHPASAADPRLQLAPQKLHTPWMDKEEDYTVALRRGEEGEEKDGVDAGTEEPDESGEEADEKTETEGEGRVGSVQEEAAGEDAEAKSNSDVGRLPDDANGSEKEPRSGREDEESPAACSSSPSATEARESVDAVSPASVALCRESGKVKAEGKETAEASSLEADSPALASVAPEGDVNAVSEERGPDAKESDAGHGGERDAAPPPLRSCLVLRASRSTSEGLSISSGSAKEGKKVKDEKEDPPADGERGDGKREDGEKDEKKSGSPEKTGERRVKKKVAFVPQVRVRPLDKELSIMEKLGAVMGPVLTGGVAASAPATGATENDEATSGEAAPGGAANKEGETFSGTLIPLDFNRRGTRSATVAAMAAERERLSPASSPAAEGAASSPAFSSVSRGGRERGRAMAGAEAAAAEEVSHVEEKDGSSRAASGSGRGGRGRGGFPLSSDSQKDESSENAPAERKAAAPGETEQGRAACPNSEESEAQSGNSRGGGRGRSPVASPEHDSETAIPTQAPESLTQPGKDTASGGSPTASRGSGRGLCPAAGKGEGDASPGSPASRSPSSPSLEDGLSKEDEDLPPWKRRKRSLGGPSATGASSLVSPSAASALPTVSVTLPSSPRDKDSSLPSSPRSASPSSRRVCVSIAAAAAAAARARKLASPGRDVGAATACTPSVARRRQGEGSEIAQHVHAVTVSAEEKPAVSVDAGSLPVGQRRTSPRCNANNGVSPSSSAAPAPRESCEDGGKTRGKIGALQVPEETSPTSGQRTPGRSSGQVSPVGRRSRSGSPSPQRPPSPERRRGLRVEDRETEGRGGEEERDGNDEQRGRKEERGGTREREEKKEDAREGKEAKPMAKPKTKTAASSASGSGRASPDSKKEASEEKSASEIGPVDATGKQKKTGKKGEKAGHTKPRVVVSPSRTTLSGRGGRQRREHRHKLQQSRRINLSSSLLTRPPLRRRAKGKSRGDSRRASSPMSSPRARSREPERRPAGAPAPVSACDPALLSSSVLGSSVSSTGVETAGALRSTGRRHRDRSGDCRGRGQARASRLCLTSDFLDASPLFVRHGQNLSLQRLPSQPPAGVLCASRRQKRRPVSTRSDGVKPLAGDGGTPTGRAPLGGQRASKRQKRVTPDLASARERQDEKHGNGVGPGGKEENNSPRHKSLPSSPCYSFFSGAAEEREDRSRGGKARKEGEKGRDFEKLSQVVTRRSADAFLSGDGDLKAEASLSGGRRNSLGSEDDGARARLKRGREATSRLFASFPALSVSVLRSERGKAEREGGIENGERDGEDGIPDRTVARQKLLQAPSSAMPRRASC